TLGLQHYRGDHAAFGRVLYANSTTMQIHNFLHHRKAKPRSTGGGFGGIEGIKDFGQVLLGNPHALVAGFPNDPAVAVLKSVKGPTFWCEIFPIPTCPSGHGKDSAGRHCLESVEEEIDEDLLDFHAIDPDSWQRSFQFTHNANFGSDGLRI